LTEPESEARGAESCERLAGVTHEYFGASKAVGERYQFDKNDSLDLINQGSLQRRRNIETRKAKSDMSRS
jgi:hypothetical protein